MYQPTRHKWSEGSWKCINDQDRSCFFTLYWKKAASSPAFFICQHMDKISLSWNLYERAQRFRSTNSFALVRTQAANSNIVYSRVVTHSTLTCSGNTSLFPIVRAPTILHCLFYLQCHQSIRRHSAVLSRSSTPYLTPYRGRHSLYAEPKTSYTWTLLSASLHGRRNHRPGVEWGVFLQEAAVGANDDTPRNKTL